MRRVRLVISGRVQGVFFRQSMKDAVDPLGVTGWVRNLISGEVEALVEGNDGAVEEVIRWSKHGPDRAAIDNVEIEELEQVQEFTQFIIRR